MFHVELRQFPHLARAFNLSAQDLHDRVLAPWVAGRRVELNERRWEPDRAKLTIYQARELASEELGLGRGWGAASREGEDVTDRLLEAARDKDRAPGELATVKDRLLASLGGATLPLHGVIGLVGEETRRVSERLALAEQAVWELLHEERLHLVDNGGIVKRDRWQPLVLRWESWAREGAVQVQAAGASGHEVGQ